MNFQTVGAQLDAIITLILGIVFLALRKEAFKGSDLFKTKKLQIFFIAGCVLMIVYGVTKIVLSALGHPI